VADILQDTYYVTSGASRSATVGGEYVSVTAVQTAAGTHDASATTKDQITSNGAGGGDPWQSNLDVDWSAIERLGSYAGTIHFIRFVFKGMYVDSGGGASCVVGVRWSGANHGDPTGLPNITAAEVHIDSYLDETSAAWTHAKLIARSFGYRLLAGGDDDSGGVGNVLTCEEFKIEVWGPEPTPQTTHIGAAAVGEAGAVGSDPPAATSTVIAASGASGAGGVSISVHFYPPLSVNVLAGIIPPPTNTFTGLPLPQAQAFAKVGQRPLRALGRPHFAFALAETLSVNAAVAGHEASAYVVFQLHRLPTAVSSPDEIHWLFSLHEVGDANREMLSIGVTPLGALASATQQDGVLLGPAGAIRADGCFHEAFLNLRSDAPSWRQLYLDGICQVASTGFSGPPAFPYPEPGVETQVSLFNGRDGLSCLDASIAAAGLNLEDYSVAWPISEGSGGVLGFTDYEENVVPNPVGFWPLVATWWDGAPIASSPENPSLPLAAAYNWGRTTAWSPRRPVQPEYRKVVS
jgi:hypothetical protein